MERRAFPRLAIRHGVVVDRSAVRAGMKRRKKVLHPPPPDCTADSSIVGGFLHLLCKQLLGSHLAASGLVDEREVFGRNGPAPDPVRDPALRHADGSRKLFLSPNNLDGTLNSAHADKISGAIKSKQERRYLESVLHSISVSNMESGALKRAKPTAADLEAAARLRAIRQRTPAAKRPTQEKIAEKLGVTQSAVSHYFTGRMRLTFGPVVLFAEMFDCQPEDIRDDLPEMQVAKAYVASNPESSANADDAELDAVWKSYSTEKKRILLGLARAADQLSSLEMKKPPMQAKVIRHRKRGAA